MKPTSKGERRIHRSAFVVRNDDPQLKEIVSSFQAHSSMADTWQLDYVVINQQPEWFNKNSNHWVCAIVVVRDSNDLDEMRKIWNEWSNSKHQKGKHLCFLGFSNVVYSVKDQFQRINTDKSNLLLSYSSQTTFDKDVLEQVLQLLSTAFKVKEQKSFSVSPEECKIGIIHLSDLHANVWDSDLKNKLLRDIHQLHLPPVRLLVVTGDLTEGGNYIEARAARKYLADIAEVMGIEWCHILVCPGNHDAWTNIKGISLPFTFRRRLQVFQDIFPPPIAAKQYKMSWFYVVKVNGLHVGLFSINSTLSKFLACGKVDVQTLKWMEQTGKNFYAEHPNGVIAVLVHHHVLTSPLLGNDYKMLMHNNGEFNEYACRAGVDLILHGHEHLAWNDDVPIFGVSGHCFHVISAGTATKKNSGTDKNNNFNVLWLCEQGFYLESREYGVDEFKLKNHISKQFIRPRSFRL